MDISGQFMEGINQFRNGEKTDEWFFSDLRERLTQELDSSEAFSAIDNVIDLVVDAQYDRDFPGEAFELLSDLVRIANTTEMPKKLRENWALISARIIPLGDYYKREVEELARYYRL